ncbi:hypothetical protein F2Q70_00014714 [Brassica cretica]|uniref:Secreted protein n=1 Tax=Brassica cretica TaxID=69181 RepID=A0A8S9I142_BRACR|nr:hypothetical protein F2Q70_00014714 [Brassica cretica]
MQLRLVQWMQLLLGRWMQVPLLQTPCSLLKYNDQIQTFTQHFIFKNFSQRISQRSLAKGDTCITSHSFAFSGNFLWNCFSITGGLTTSHPPRGRYAGEGYHADLGSVEGGSYVRIFLCLVLNCSCFEVVLVYFDEMFLFI